MNPIKSSIIDYKATGAHIKALMDKNGISTRKISNTLGISYQAVHGYIQGVKRPTTEHLYMISKILKTSVEEILIPISEDFPK